MQIISQLSLIHIWLEGGLLTVTRLYVTPDLDVAKVYVSVMGRADGPKPAIEALNLSLIHIWPAPVGCRF